MELKQQVVKGVSWNFLDQIIRQAISIGVITVLARILSPSDYGLVALSSIFVGFLSLFGDLSIGSAIIQKSDINNLHISTSFWATVFTGICLTIVLFVLAPFVAEYYDQPQLIYIIDISAVGFVITPIWSTHKILMTKKLEFKKLAQINIAFAIITALSSLILALSGLGVWSLVLSGLIASALITPLVWHYEKWRPRFFFDKNCFRELFRFSSYLLSFNVINYFARNFDNLIVGKHLGANALGIYSMAYNLMMKPLQQISWSITAVLFPAFSSIQKDIPRIKFAYLKVVNGIATVTFPMMMGLIMVSREFILIMAGQKWEGVVQPLQVLCLVGALQSIGTTVGSIFSSLGRTDLQFKTGTISAFGHVIGFIICIRWGLMGLVKGYLVTNIIFICFTQYYVLRLLNLSVKDFIAVLKTPAINSTIMVMTLIGYRQIDSHLIHMHIFLNFITSICLGIFVYTALTIFLAGRDNILEYKQIIIKCSGFNKGDC